MEPANRALHDPARLAKAAAMSCHRSGGPGLDSLNVEQPTVYGQPEQRGACTTGGQRAAIWSRRKRKGESDEQLNPFVGLKKRLSFCPLSAIADNPAPVAQLDRVLPSEGRGRAFESRRARQLSPPSPFMAAWSMAATRSQVDLPFSVFARAAASYTGTGKAGNRFKEGAAVPAGNLLGQAG